MTRLTPKQELFAQKYIELGNASEAYRTAYDAKGTDKTVWEAASRLLADSKVSARVNEWKSYHAARHAVTVDSITTELEEARILAIGEKQTSAAVSASMGKAKLHGLIVEKNKLAGKDGGPIKAEVTVTLTPEEAYRKMLNGDG